MKSDRPIERWLLAESNATESAPLRERARHDEQLRNLYDDYFAVLRALERGEGSRPVERAGADSSAFSDHASASVEELRWLERDFFQTLPQARERGFGAWFARISWLHVYPSLGLVVALLAIGIVLSDRRAFDDGSLVARGRGEHAELELEVFCGNPPAQVNDGRCQLTQELTFAVRATSDGESRTLSVFGVGSDGAPSYYAPTPKRAEGMRVTSTRWQPADFSVQLAVNHRAGPLRIFAVLAPRPLTIDEVDDFAQTISMHPALFAGSEAWITRMRQLDAEVAEDVCPAPEACDAVQTQLWLDPSGETP